MPTARRRSVALVVVLLVDAGAACGTASHPAATATSSKLTSPNISPAQSAQFLSDVTEADPALATYVQSDGSVALRALLTDGSAFCAFLLRDGGINAAMVSLAVGARSVESQTHLPSTVTTFNTVEAVALLTLCPSEQKLVPASDRSRISDLGQALAKPSS